MNILYGSSSELGEMTLVRVFDLTGLLETDDLVCIPMTSGDIRDLHLDTENCAALEIQGSWQAKSFLPSTRRVKARQNSSLKGCP